MTQLLAIDACPPPSIPPRGTTNPFTDTIEGLGYAPTRIAKPAQYLRGGDWDRALHTFALHGWERKNACFACLLA